jgi:hypothetical protein
MAKFSTHAFTIPKVGKVHLKLPKTFGGPANRAGARWKRITAAVQKANKKKKLKASATCPVIVFKAGTNSPVAVQRCENSTFFSRKGKGSFAAKQKSKCSSGRMTAKQKKAFKGCR